MNNEKIFQEIRLNDNERLLEILPSIDVNIKNKYGQSLLHEAAAYKNLTSALELLKYEIDLNAQDKQGLTPLHYCAENGSTTLAHAILEKGASLKIEDIHKNELLWTATFNARGNYETVILFMTHGADPNHTNKYGKSPIDFANQINDSKLQDILSSD